MNTPDDPSFWKDAATWIAGTAVALISLVWADNKRRIDNLEKTINEKADKEDLDRQRDHVVSLFKEQADLRRDMNGGFSRVTELLHNGQVQILTELGKKADR